MMFSRLSRGLYTLLAFTMVIGYAAQASAQRDNLLPNGSVEDGVYPDGPFGWKRQAFGPEASLTWDMEFAHGGAHSVKILASQPNDAAWIQTITVAPNTNYLLSGWIKTDSVAHTEGSVGANLCLFGTWQQTAAVIGTTDWTQVRMSFNSGPSGTVTIGARLGYWSGTTTGTAWFDDMRVTEIRATDPHPDWKLLALVYDTTDFTYSDQSVTRHVIGHIDPAQVAAAASAVSRFVLQDIPALTSGNMMPQMTIRYPGRLTHLSPSGGGWWPSPADTANDDDPAFDSVIVIWQPTVVDQTTGEGLWIGSAAGLTPPMGTGQAYTTLIIEAATTYGHLNVFKHEWGHSILSYFDALGTAPRPTVTNHTDGMTYVNCQSGAYYVWQDETDANPIPNSIYNNASGFTHDYYSGTTALATDPRSCLGITPSAWATGGPVSKPQVPFEYFSYTARDIGDVGQAGTASVASGTFFVAGAGGDIWGTADAFHYVSNRLLGSGYTTTFVARVSAEQNTNPFAKAGLMIRTSFDASAGDVILDIKPDGSIEFMTRPQTGGSTIFVGGASASFPVWLRLVYDGQTVTGSISQDGSTWSSVGSTNLVGGLYIGLAVTSHDPAVLNQAVFDNVGGSATLNGGTLPSGWTQQNVGTTGLVGTASYSNGTFTVGGAGADIWGTFDSFNYVYDIAVSPPNASGLDGTEMTAHVTSIENTDTFAKAGIMIRESLDPGSANVILDVKPGGDVEFMARLSSGAQMTFFAGGSLPPTSAWLRLVLTPGVATGYISSDGVNWSKVGAIPITFPEDHYLGLAVTSHDTTVLNTATFDNVLVGWSSQDVGSVGVPGSVRFEDRKFIISGAGRDIWGTADSFHYVYRPLSLAGSGSGHTITVNLQSLENTNPFAKAGVMIRDSLDPGAATVILDVKPDGGVEFMARRTAGTAMTFIGGGTYPLSDAYTLRLVMDGQTFSGYVCQPFSPCQLIGTTTASISADGLIGMAVTSHDPNIVNTAAFNVPVIQ